MGNDYTLLSITPQINTGVLFLEYIQGYQSQEFENEVTGLQQRESKTCQSCKKIDHIHTITHIHIFLQGPLYLTSELCESPFLVYLYTGQKLDLKKYKKTLQILSLSCDFRRYIF